jgi:hypothetical protein
MDHAEAARARLTLAARASKKLSDGQADWQPEAAGGLLDAAIAIGYALLDVTDAIREQTEAVTGPDGVLDRLGVIGDHLDRMRGDVADLARLANHR